MRLLPIAFICLTLSSCGSEATVDSNEVPPPDQALTAQAPVRREQKIIWDYNENYTYQADDSSDPMGAAILSEENSKYVANYCKGLSENFENYKNNGWIIISMNPSTRNAPPNGLLGGGICEGRDVLVELSQ